MLFTKQDVSGSELKDIQNFFEQFENSEIKTTAVSETSEQNAVCKYLHSLVTSCYQKSVEDIANTKIGNKRLRKRNLQQVMQEGFFAGANRFGNNFIA